MLGNGITQSTWFLLFVQYIQLIKSESKHMVFMGGVHRVMDGVFLKAFLPLAYGNGCRKYNILLQI